MGAATSRVPTTIDRRAFVYDTTGARRAAFAEAMAELEAVHQTYTGMGVSPTVKLLSLIEESALAGYTHRQIEIWQIIVDLSTALNVVNSIELETLYRLAREDEWIRKGAFFASFGVGLPSAYMTAYGQEIPELPLYFDFVKVMHRYLGVSKSYFLLYGLERFSQMAAFSGSSFESLQKNQNIAETVVAWIQWCLDKMLVRELTKSDSLLAKRALEVIFANEEHVISNLAFQTLVQEFPFNIKYTDPATGATTSIASNFALDRERSDEYPIARIMLPRLFRSNTPLVIDGSKIPLYMSIAIKANASLEQLDQIYSTAGRINQQIGDVEYEIIRWASHVGRLDVMQKYGFGPAYLPLLRDDNDILAFVRYCRADIREGVLANLGLSRSKTVALTRQIETEYS